MQEEIASEYASNIQELVNNSKPIINTLTMVAGENIHAARQIVNVITNRIIEVSFFFFFFIFNQILLFIS